MSTSSKSTDKVTWLAAQSGIQGRGAVQRWRPFHPIERHIEILMRSQGVVGSGSALATSPLCRVTRLEPHLFRILLLRRLRLHLPFDRAKLPMWLSARFQDNDAQQCVETDVHAQGREHSQRRSVSSSKADEESKAKLTEGVAATSRIEATATPAPISKSPEERDFVVDSRASMHMLSEKDLSSDEMETLRRSRNPTCKQTRKRKCTFTILISS